VHRLRATRGNWLPRSEAHQHVIYRAGESHNAYERTPIYSAHDAFGKKIENHAAAVALQMLHYNFVRIHQTLKVTPAMAAGVTDRLWDIADERELPRAA